MSDFLVKNPQKSNFLTILAKSLPKSHSGVDNFWTQKVLEVII